MTEEWRDIPGIEGRYQASSLGQIKSLSRRVPCSQGTRLIKERILKQAALDDGYLVVTICVGSKSKQSARKVHHLVLLAFHGERPEGLESRHLDDDPSNCRLSNLCYGTRAENIADRHRNRPGNYKGRRDVDNH